MMKLRWMKDVNPSDRLVALSVLCIYAVCLAVFGVLLLAVFKPTPVNAQIGGNVYSRKSASEPHGSIRTMWNTTETEIEGGLLVMSDTISVTSQGQVAYGKGFRTWSGVPADAHRILGILMSTTPGYQQGYVLMEGAYFNALLDATGIAAGACLRPSLTVAGALTTATCVDSSNGSYRMKIGKFQRYKDGTSLRGYVEIDMAGKR